jgi:hypothetical protein
LHGEMAPALHAHAFQYAKGSAIASATFLGIGWPARQRWGACLRGPLLRDRLPARDENWPAGQSRGRLPADGARGTSSAAQRQPAGGDRR